MPESVRHMLIAQLFASCLRMLLEQQGRDDFVGENQLFAWVEKSPNVRLAPDVYLAQKGAVPLDGLVETWKPGLRPPPFALEVVSEDRKKDYDNAPQQYADLGVEELVVFDPAAEHVRSSKRRLLAMFRRQPDGRFAQVSAGGRPVYSEVLHAWVVPHRSNDMVYVRLARDEAGKDLVPTETEQMVVERRAKEAAIARALVATARAEAAEAQNRELLEKLRALTAGPSSE